MCLMFLKDFQISQTSRLSKSTQYKTVLEFYGPLPLQIHYLGCHAVEVTRLIKLNASRHVHNPDLHLAILMSSSRHRADTIRGDLFNIKAAPNINTEIKDVAVTCKVY